MDSAFVLSPNSPAIARPTPEDSTTIAIALYLLRMDTIAGSI